MWGETTFALAFLGHEDGWEHECFRGVDLVSNHLTGTAIIVTAGDGATGNPDHSPQVRYERGEIISGLVNGELDTLWDAERGRADWSVWFLVHHLGSVALAVPAELSLPNQIAADGMVTRWVERIVIPSADEAGPGLGAATPDEPSLTPVVHVQRRAE